MELVMTVKERKLLFRFTTRAWWNIEQKVGSLGALMERMGSDDKPLDAMTLLCAETATAGAKHEGTNEKITQDWILDNLTPKEVKRAGQMAKNAVTVGMRRENVEQDDEEVIDAILEEIKAEERAKKERAERTTDRT